MKQTKKNWLEWTVFAASALLVAGVIGYVAFSAATLGNSPPRIEIEFGAIEQQGDRFIVPVSATNRGDKMAEAVVIEITATVKSEAAEDERAELTIEYIPRRATRKGLVTFKTPVRQADLSARVVGYETP